jgi:hypothetical protein
MNILLLFCASKDHNGLITRMVEQVSATTEVFEIKTTQVLTGIYYALEQGDYDLLVLVDDPETVDSSNIVDTLKIVEPETTVLLLSEQSVKANYDGFLELPTSQDALANMLEYLASKTDFATV